MEPKEHFIKTKMFYLYHYINITGEVIFLFRKWVILIKLGKMKELGLILISLGI
jgi:hypothetical protein